MVNKPISYHRNMKEIVSTCKSCSRKCKLYGDRYVVENMNVGCSKRTLWTGGLLLENEHYNTPY